MSSLFNFLSNSEVLRIRELLRISSLEVVLKSEWGSREPGHREQIHSQLKKKMAHAYPLSDSSISHCPSLGGFVFAQQGKQNIFQIGFDVEETARISDAAARRICQTAAEFELAPSSASLWTAKEAAYKSLKGPSQPATVSEVTLTSWSLVSSARESATGSLAALGHESSLDSQIEIFQMKDSGKYFFNSTVGVVIKKDPYSLAFFICHL